MRMSFETLAILAFFGDKNAEVAMNSFHTMKTLEQKLGNFMETQAWVDHGSIRVGLIWKV